MNSNKFLNDMVNQFIDNMKTECDNSLRDKEGKDKNNEYKI